MKIGIISDTHDNVPNMGKALSWMNLNKIEVLIHCGDLCSPDILINVLAPQFSGPIHMVFGNVEDRDSLLNKTKEFRHVTHYGDSGKFEIDGHIIGCVHYPEPAKKMAQTGEYDLVFYGHSHKPWEENINNARVINPGTLAGLFQKATFAVFDTKTEKLELKILEKL